MNILRNKIVLYSLFLVVLMLYSCCFYSADARRVTGPVEFQFRAKDSFNMFGSIEVPKSASVKNKAPLVIFLHSLGKSKIEWQAYASKIKEQNPNAAILILDLRGHGQSIIDGKGKRKYWQNFKNKDFQKYPDDISSAMDAVRQQYPEVNINKVALVASNISANAAVIAASKNNKSIKTLILLSPTVTYKGIETRIPMVNYGNHPVLVMVSKKDAFSYDGSSELIKYVQGVKEFKVFPDGGNGTSLLKFQPGAQKVVFDWLDKYFFEASK
ncbi:MAG: hypothetical protein A2287_08515 [Candidatus Melainabacteria bacterium RIFOXYA12_FULL_32_12]|nr:MAG: hypothetical protein A2255_03085 [Candidatus Melainabacteria bacterium RIFOXYA2_FULL_32_9]OGI24892.1 MAG: hypothetical protein A2287_08515 [Candidatus Melainabacteria bacterium RIFOXYA12_FULL_32_12]